MTSHDPAISRTNRLVEQLAERWLSLGLPLWRIAPDGGVQRASMSEAWTATLENPQIESALRTAACEPQQNIENFLEISPGCWLLRATVPFGGKRGGRLATVLLSEHFAGDPARTLPRYSSGQVPGMAQTFAWTVKDLAAQIGDGETLTQYSDRLAQAYEETNLLFRMARLLNVTDDPQVVIKAISSQIQQIFPFQWICIQFDDLPEVLQPLRGELFLCGSPASAERVRFAALSILRDFRGQDTWTKILHSGNSGQAALLATELVAEPIMHDNKAIGILLAGDKQGEDPQVSSFEMQFLDAAAEFLGVFHANTSRFAEQQRMFMGTLRALTASIDAKDHYTRGHSDRVGLLAEQMAAAIGLTPHQAERYRIAGLVHDVGKIGVPEAVLCKPGRLTDEEFALIRQHPQIGHEILKDIPALADVLPGVLSHHEKWNGKGYPHGISGEEIPTIARVLALCDTFDAMSSNRAYRSALSHETVLSEIQKCAGSQFDPQLAGIFVGLDFTSYHESLRTERATRIAA